MSLSIYFSCSPELLAEKLAENLSTERRINTNPFLAGCVMVPNINLKQWLQLQIADLNSVAANIEFPFFEKGLWKILQRIDPESANAGKDAEPRLLERDLLHLLVLTWLGNSIQKKDKTISEFSSYISGNDSSRNRKLWQLSSRLTALLGDYEYHRREWFDQWRLNCSIQGMRSKQSVESIEKAEKALFSGIFSPDGMRIHLKDDTGTEYLLLSEYADRVLKSPINSSSIDNREPIHVFGMSRLPPSHVECLFRISQFVDIRLYQFVVCCEFWEDMPTLAEQRRFRREEFKRVRELRLPSQPEDERPALDLSLIENPLLQAWGHAGRETIVLLTEYEERFPKAKCVGEWLCETEPGKETSVLHRLQHSIRHRCSRVKRSEPDNSLQIIACPSIYREVDMVYNSIIHNMEADQDLKLTDIAVLVTDMGKYKPVFEYVFDGCGQVPYNLIDSSAATESAFGQAVLSLLNLAGGYFTRKDVFELILNPCFLAGGQISQEEALQWLKWADKLGIYREYNGKNGKDDGKQMTLDTDLVESTNNQFSWRHGLLRLRFGRIMSCDTEDEVETFNDFQGITPYADLESHDAKAIGRLSVVIESLYIRLSHLADTSYTLQQWRRHIEELFNDFLGIPSDRAPEAFVRSGLLRALITAETLDKLSKFETRIPLQLLQELIKTALAGIAGRKGTYLSRGVSLSSLRPMRPVPFKIIYVLGMKEGDFPGNNDTTMLDLRRYYRPMPGDVSLPDANRYLFLETLMAVRKKLYISYVSDDLKKDEKFFPCSVLKQLINFLNESVLTVKQPIVELPLNGNSLRYLEGSAKDMIYNDVLVNFSRSDRLQALASVLSNVDSSKELNIQLSPDWDCNHYKQEVCKLLENAQPDFTPPDETPAEIPNIIPIPLRELARFLENPVEAGIRHHLGIYEDREEAIALAEDEPFYSMFPADWKFETETLKEFVRNYWQADYTSQHIQSVNDRFQAYLYSLYKSEQKHSMMPAAIFGNLDRKILMDRIISRIVGSSGVKESLYQLLSNLHDNKLTQVCNVAIGTGDSEARSDLRFPALHIEQTGRNGKLYQVELSGSLPLAWREESKGPLRACLMITTKSAIHEDSPTRDVFVPILFLIALCAGGYLPVGVNFIIHLSHRKGISSFNYNAWPANTARKWLTRLVSDFLGKNAFDLLPYPVVLESGNNTIKPHGDQDVASQAIAFCKRLKTDIEAAVDKPYPSYRPPEILKLVSTVVPNDALAKACERLGPIITREIPNERTIDEL